MGRKTNRTRARSREVIRQRRERQQRRERLYARKPGRRPKVYRRKLYGEGGTKKARPELFRPYRGREHGVAWGGRRSYLDPFRNLKRMKGFKLF